MSEEPSIYNEWFCKGAKWFLDGLPLSDGLTGVAFCGGSKQDIFAFVRGYNSTKPTPPVEHEKEDR